jgi:hypothetical protein
MMKILSMPWIIENEKNPQEKMCSMKNLEILPGVCE